MFLIAYDRRDALIALEVSAFRERLLDMLAFIEKLFPGVPVVTASVAENHVSKTASV